MVWKRECTPLSEPVSYRVSPYCATAFIVLRSGIEPLLILPSATVNFADANALPLSYRRVISFRAQNFHCKLFYVFIVFFIQFFVFFIQFFQIAVYDSGIMHFDRHQMCHLC